MRAFTEIGPEIVGRIGSQQEALEFVAVAVDDGALRYVVGELLGDVAARADGPFAERFSGGEIEIEYVAGVVIRRGVLGVDVEERVERQVPVVLEICERKVRLKVRKVVGDRRGRVTLAPEGKALL